MYFHIHPDVDSYHFECRSFEFQTDRQSDTRKRLELLSDTVPSIDKDCLHTDGDIPFISFFVTHYNKLQYLHECLSSIRGSTSFRFEVIILDDCTECSTGDIECRIPDSIKKYCKIVRQASRIGVEQAFAAALAHCRGEFIAQLDADDYLLPNAVDVLVNTMVAKGADLAYGKHKVLKDGELSDGWACRYSTRELRLLAGMYYHPLRVFRSRALHRVGGMRILGIRGAVDFSLYSQIELVCEALFCDVFTYVYRVVHDAISQINFEAQVEGVRVVIDDNARKLSTTCDYTITQTGTRAFRVEFSDDDTVGYKDHLGLR
jgi:glycosyltransferase involved in cell wall biosynthesis